MLGAVRGIDPETGNHFDDTRRYIEASIILTPERKRAIFAGNARRVYPRMRGF
jgi:4-oxalmesaconate hydratase